MKKVLTLVSALSMVAGSAFAHDYAWSVDKIPSTDKGVVKNTKGLLKYDGKKFTFNAEAGDFVTVLVNNNDATSDMTVIIGGVKNVVEKGTAVTLTQTVNAGEVAIEVTGTGYVTEIKVASAAGKRVEGYIKDAQAVLNEANKETAAYAGGDLDPFFTAVRSQLNAQGVEIEKQSVVLRELLASNDAFAVSNKENDIWKALLDTNDVNSVTNKITNIKNNAKTAKSTLDKIVASTNATDAKAAIEKAETTSLTGPTFLGAYKADGTTPATKVSDVKVIKGNDSNDAKPYIYNFTVKSYKNGQWTWEKAGLKRDWAKTELEAIKKEYSGVKTAIIAKMAKEFEETANSFQAAGNSESDLSALYDAVKSSVGYMTERIHVEVHHAAHISELASDVTTLDGVIGDFGYPTTEAEYNTWKTDVNDLKGAIADATTRHSANSVNTLNADKTVKGLIATTCDNAQATQATYREKILGTAYGKVKAEFDKVQNKLNEYSYKISAKYQNEKDIQQVYEKKFAELQNSLNTIEGLYQGKPGTIITDMSAAWNYMVTKYADRLSELNSKSKALDDMWGETIQKQQQQVIDDNNKALNTLTAQIKAVRDYYDVQVAKIAGYREFVPSSSATEAINTSLKELFNIVLGLEAKQDEINKKVEKCNTASKNATDVEFNADSDQYRFKSVTTDSNGQNVSYEDAINAIKDAIETQVKVAIGKANEATLKYIYLSRNSYITGTEKYASVTGLRSLISNKQLLQKEENCQMVNREMSTAAATAFKDEYAHVDWNKVSEKQPDGTTKDVQKGYIALAEEMIKPLLTAGSYSESGNQLVVTVATTCAEADAAIPAAGKVAANLVDQIASIKSLYLDPAKKAIDDIDTELVSYEDQYKKIGELKIKWTVDKANLDELAKKASAADPSMTKANFEGELNAINTEIKSISAQLEANAISATKVAEKTAETLKAQGIALAKLEKYDVWFANKQAKTEADKLYAEVAKNLQGAKDALAKMNENVQAKYGPAFDQNTTDLENAKVTLDKAVVDDLDATTANIAAAKGVLETIKNEIAATLKAAEEANKTDESLDYNKDGEINDKDHLAAQDDTTNGVITLDTYYDWVNKFVDYQTNSK